MVQSRKRMVKKKKDGEQTIEGWWVYLKLWGVPQMYSQQSRVTRNRPVVAIHTHTERERVHAWVKSWVQEAWRKWKSSSQSWCQESIPLDCQPNKKRKHVIKCHPHNWYSIFNNTFCYFPSNRINAVVHGFVLSPSVVFTSFAIPWIVARQVPLFHGISQASIGKWVAISWSMESFCSCCLIIAIMSNIFAK